jgi:hypothetical protein
MSETKPIGGVEWSEPPALRVDAARPRTAARRAFAAGHEAPSLVLMSRENPEGWKLEDLLDQIIAELDTKTNRLLSDTSSLALHVISNNRAIMSKLLRCAAVQRNTIAALAAHAPDQGPRGKPRIGS